MLGMTTRYNWGSISPTYQALHPFLKLYIYYVIIYIFLTFQSFDIHDRECVQKEVNFAIVLLNKLYFGIVLLILTIDISVPFHSSISLDNWT